MTRTLNHSILGLTLLAGAAVAITKDTRPVVQWGACPAVEPYVDASAPIECGNIRLPLDYTEPNSTALWDVPLVRVKALQQPSKGSIFMNWGGPGLTSTDLTARRGAILLTYVYSKLP